MVAPAIAAVSFSAAVLMAEPSPERTLARLMTIGQVGMEMAAPIGVGFLIDYWLGTLPISMIVGAVLGFFYGIYRLVVLNRPPSK